MIKPEDEGEFEDDYDFGTSPMGEIRSFRVSKRLHDSGAMSGRFCPQCRWQISSCVLRHRRDAYDTFRSV